MTNQIVLHFPLTGGGPDQGPNDSGLEHFMGDIPKHIARECAQNSIDAARKSSSKKPVRLEFGISRMLLTELPGLEELKSAVIPACRRYYDKDPKAKKYCDRALDALSAKEIPVLRIADYETTGLKGADDDRTGQWYSLVKSSGVSSKDSGAAGSFGIGKHAPFAASAVKTVYYRTMTETGDVAFQGISKWWSHENGKGQVTQGTGFIGVLDEHAVVCRTVRNPTGIPPVFSRTEPGTDIWIPAFVEEDPWVDNIVRHLLANFWLAVYQSDIEFVVGGKAIRKDNLELLLEEYSTHEDFFAQHYYRALTSANSNKAIEKFSFLGEMELHLLASDEDKLPKYVQGMRRTGMVIEEKRFNCRRHYVGVLLCRNEEGNAFLRSIEPPRHDRWERERITERRGKTAFDSMWGWVRRKVQDLNPKPTSEAVDVPNLSRYLPDFPEKDASKKDGEPGIESKAAKAEIPVSETKGMRPKIRSNSGGEGEGEGLAGKKESGAGGSGGSGGGGQKSGPELVKPIHLRAIRISDTSYRVIARAETQERGNLTLQVVNDDGSLDATLIKEVRRNGKSLDRDGNSIRAVEFSDTDPLVLELELASPIPVTLAGTLRVSKEESR